MPHDRTMRTLSGTKLKVVRVATKRYAYMLNGTEITLEHASHLARVAIEDRIARSTWYPDNLLIAIVAARDLATKEHPLKTSAGALWCELVAL